MKEMQHRTDDLRIREIRELSPPSHVLRELPVTEKAALEQCRQVGDVIGVQMRDGNGIERLELCFGFAEAQENASPCIDQKPRFAIQPQQIP